MKILLLNYYWPPCGGPAVQRWLDISNNLAKLGIQTIVVTVDKDKATYPVIDTSLLKRIDPSTRIFQTDTSELFSLYKKFIGNGKTPAPGLSDEPHPTFLQKVARFVRGNILLPDPRRGWNKHAYKEATRLIREENISTIFTAGPPQSTHLTGLKLKKKFPYITWIADFHDYWTEISYLSKFYRTRLAESIDRRYEQAVLENADYIMTHCLSSVRIQKEKIKIGKEKIFAHTMGFNEQLFSFHSPVTQEQFVISYTGTLSESYEPDIFFKALKTAKSNHPDVPLAIRFVGAITPGITRIVNYEGLSENFINPGYVPHEKVVKYLYESSALLLINPRLNGEPNIVPGKIYEYLAVFKPIISISSPGSENDMIIQSMKAGRNFGWDDHDALAAYLSELISKWKISKNIDLPPNDDVKKYGRAYESRILAQRIKKCRL